MKYTRISSEVVDTLIHILNARIDNCSQENYIAWTTAKDIVEYALANNLDALKEYDYLEEKEWYIDFSGYCKIKAKTKEEAERKFWSGMTPPSRECFDDIYDIENIEEN
jgi:hypothetical protein